MDSINLTVALVSLAAALIPIFLLIEARTSSWTKVKKLTMKLIEQIRNDGYEPDCIIGVGRGGAIVAGLISGNMGGVALYVVDTILSKTKGVTSVDVRYDCFPDLKDQRVLLVVGEVYSGKDLTQAMEFVRTKEVGSYKTLSMYYHPASVIRPDFIGIETSKPLSAPWRISTSYKSNRH